MDENDEDPELLEALEPVRQYFSGKEVTVNTVLAAYLRSVGLSAFGEAWETAKLAVQEGYSFQQAVRVAARSYERPAPVPAMTSPFQSRRALGWFPKQFGPGDIDGVGAKRLLGTPNIEPAWVLVRETSQNSWDARGISPVIGFTLNLRLLDEPLVEILRSRVFTGDPPGTGLADLLRHDEIWALEVSDRGTVGLGGPIRNDLAIEPGIDRNFIDLVFNIGAPRDVHLGGGTYGFGKTITYLLSSVGTVLIWSRCDGKTGQEDRLIGSAIGEAFNMDGSRYTGRHWWGNIITTENRVEPVVGSLARELGDAIFADHFEPDATGTSILILNPQLGGSTPQENVQLLAEAVTWNLWPKLIADQSGRSQMNISIQLNGQPVALPDIQKHPVLSGYAQCLLAVRAAESKTPSENLGQRYPVEWQEVWCMQPRTLLGHLALTRYPSPPRLKNRAHSVALMRQAELIVKYFERRDLDVDGFQWAGVFKAAVEVDDAFSLAEPPAHDDWVPQAVEDKRRRREVNVALRRVKETADDYLLPRADSSAESLETVPSAVNVADMLADLLSGQEGAAPTRIVLQGAKGLGAAIVPTPDDLASPRDPDAGNSGTATGPGRAGRRRAPASQERPRARPRADVTSVSREHAPTPGWSRTAVRVQLSVTSPPGTAVDVAVRVGVEGGSMEDAGLVRILGWRDERSGTYDPRPQALSPGEARLFVFESRSDLAIDIETRLGAG
jgi:hypothetical protein